MIQIKYFYSITFIEKYKKQYAKTWFQDATDLSDIKFTEDMSEWSERESISDLLDAVEE